MDLDCQGCAGCCLDWRSLVDAGAHAHREGDHEHRGPYPPLDGTYNLVPLTRDEVRDFLDAGLAEALTPRLWAADADDPGVEIDGQRVAAVAGRPAFFVGLRKPPKPVAPFGLDEPRWLPTCVFLDPESLQCRIHGTDRYPAECRDYPAHNLALDEETECERVEAQFDGDRLRSTDVDEESLDGFLFGPQAIGGKVFVHPDPETLEGTIDRIASGETTREDRAELVAIAAASAPGTIAHSESHYETALEQALTADSWVGRAIDDWTRRSADVDASPDPTVADAVEEARGAPETPGWTSHNVH